MFRTVFPEQVEGYNEEELYYAEEIDMKESTDQAGLVVVIMGSTISFAGIVGIIGGIIVKNHNVAGGIMMILASIVTLFTLWAIVSFVILLLGGILAFVNDSRPPKYQPMQNYQQEA